MVEFSITVHSYCQRLTNPSCFYNPHFLAILSPAVCLVWMLNLYQIKLNWEISDLEVFRPNNVTDQGQTPWGVKTDDFATPHLNSLIIL